MKSSNTWKQVFQQLKGGRVWDLMAGTLVCLCLRLIALCPLLTLLSDEALPYVWLATPVMLILLILPLRFSAAEAMADFLAGGRFCTLKLVSLRDYGRKLGAALRHAGMLLIWALPLLAAVAYIAFVFVGGGELDGFTVLRHLGNIGMLVGGSFMEGIILLVLALIVLALPLIYGLVRLSGGRHLWAANAPRECLAGSRLRQLGLGLVNGIVICPIFLTFVLILKDILVYFIDNFELPSLMPYVYVIAGVFLLVYLPLMPLRKMAVAIFARSCAQKDQPYAA